MSMTSVPDSELPKLVRFPEFFDRLQETGALDAKGAVQSETEIDGIVYHHRGVQVPSHEATFVWEPADDRPVPTFSLEVSAVGPRNAHAVFDATREWDMYLLLFEGGGVVAWMTDEEFEREEADEFRTKADAVEAGRFSFGAFFRFGPDWVEREEWALESTAPAMLQLGEGGLLAPDTPSEFYEHAAGIPPELRPGTDEGAPDYLGLYDVGLSVD